jgi:1-phosphatidylinositol-3-phosphate 5-kinase
MCQIRESALKRSGRLADWTIRQALLDIAPSYLEHLANTHNRATSLAKIVGFYTGEAVPSLSIRHSLICSSVKIHDLQSSSRKQLDLLVMENLFYKQDISQTFDLKGIGK